MYLLKFDFFYTEVKRQYRSYLLQTIDVGEGYGKNS
jgi:hypothetical protein